MMVYVLRITVRRMAPPIRPGDASQKRLSPPLNAAPIRSVDLVSSHWFHALLQTAAIPSPALQRVAKWPPAFRERTAANCRHALWSMLPKRQLMEFTSDLLFSCIRSNAQCMFYFFHVTGAFPRANSV
ncbi:hypothetical protein [Paraburkholderia xenovorans]